MYFEVNDIFNDLLNLPLLTEDLIRKLVESRFVEYYREITSRYKCGRHFLVIVLRVTVFIPARTNNYL